MMSHQFLSPTVLIQGEAESCGAYLLGIELLKPCRLAFGRHNQGIPIGLPAGRYLYIGSAHGQKGSSALPARLLRHTCRSAAKPSHVVQPFLAQALQAAGMPARIPAQKTIRWHIDYLLDEPAAEIFAIFAHRTSRQIEQSLAETLAALPETQILSKGLGASDHPGGTHLLWVQADNNWWNQLPNILAQA